MTGHPRYVQALWYAWGQQDAGIGLEVDAQAFATAHATHAVMFEASQASTSFLPSVMGAWQAYREALS